MLGSRYTIGATIIPATAPTARRQAPAQREHPADADADQAARRRVLRRRAHGKPERREAEEGESSQQHDQRHRDHADLVGADIAFRA